MLDFVIFAVTFAVALICFVFYLYPGSRRVTTIPGMDPSDAKEGNLPDIILAGGLHPFLVQLHEDHGPIASFWYEEQLTVSLASPELFKEHIKVFDRPPILFKQYEKLLQKHSIQYANGSEGRKRKKDYERFFNNIACTDYYPLFDQIGSEIIKKWNSMPKGQHVPLHQYMIALALKAILRCGFGSYFEDEKNIIKLHKLYEMVWNELNAKCSGSVSEQDDASEKRLDDDVQKIRFMVKEIIEGRKVSKSSEEYFVDFLIETGVPQEQIISESITFLVGGFHTTGNLLTWMLYFISTHNDVQERLYKELKEVLKDESVSSENIGKLNYTRQVIDESLRCSVLAPFAARFQDIDVEIGGHIVPKSTPVVHALGVVLHDPKLWAMPKKFDPDRFSPENVKSRPSLAFVPFGFAGQRICPGQKFAYAEVTSFLALVCRNFKLSLVEGQVVKPVYTLISRPEEEVWITVTPRN